MNKHVVAARQIGFNEAVSFVRKPLDHLSPLAGRSVFLLHVIIRTPV